MWQDRPTLPEWLCEPHVGINCASQVWTCPRPRSPWEKYHPPGTAPQSGIWKYSQLLIAQQLLLAVCSVVFLSIICILCFLDWVFSPV